MPIVNGHWVAGRFHDFTGAKIGRWTVLEFVGQAHWLCRCECGTERRVASSGLLKRTSQSCGCLHRDNVKARHATAPRYADLTGQKFSRLVALERLPSTNSKPGTMWLCRCDCGKEKPIKSTYLLKGVIHSCGCLCLERKSRKHGMWKSREYGIWCSMKTRCGPNNIAAAEDYHDRGIRVCARWRESFSDFFADMGARPGEGYSLDRIDNNSGYTCGHCEECKLRGATANCRWATGSQQQQNTRRTHLITFNGKTQSLFAWARELGIKPITLYCRLIKQKWPVEKALTTPARRKERRLD